MSDDSDEQECSDCQEWGQGIEDREDGKGLLCIDCRGLAELIDWEHEID